MMDLWSRFSQLHTPSSIVFSLSPQRAFSIQNDLHTNALPRPSLPAAQASCILQLVKYIQKLQQKDVEVAEEVNALFAGELNPVAPKAQKKVPVPEGWSTFPTS